MHWTGVHLPAGSPGLPPDLVRGHFETPLRQLARLALPLLQALPALLGWLALYRYGTNLPVVEQALLEIPWARLGWWAVGRVVPRALLGLVLEWRLWRWGRNG